MVRIVKGDFWTNFETYEDVIKRCFTYLYFKKFPSEDPQGETESFDNLIVEMNRLSVFDRFDVKRPNPANHTIDKSFEQFLFKWTEQILYREYHDRRRRTIRFRRINDVDLIHRDTYDPRLHTEIFADEPTIDVDELPPGKKETEIKRRRFQHKMSAKYPTVRNIPDMCSEKYENPDEILQEQDTWEQVLASCRDSQERRIVEMKREGTTTEDIGRAIGCTGSGICAILVSINKRYKRRALSMAA